MTQEDLELLEGLLARLRAFGVTEYESQDVCLKLQPAWPPPGATDTKAGGPEEDDFNPAEAYKKAIEQAAEAIVQANAKRS